MSGRTASIDVSDRGGAIFAAGVATFETVRKARSDLVAGAVVRVREDMGRQHYRFVDRGEWMIRGAVPEPGREGCVRLTLHRLADVYVRAPGRH